MGPLISWQHASTSCPLGSIDLTEPADAPPTAPAAGWNDLGPWELVAACPNGINVVLFWKRWLRANRG